MFLNLSRLRLQLEKWQEMFFFLKPFCKQRAAKDSKIFIFTTPLRIVTSHSETENSKALFSYDFSQYSVHKILLKDNIFSYISHCAFSFQTWVDAYSQKEKKIHLRKDQLWILKHPCIKSVHYFLWKTTLHWDPDCASDFSELYWAIFAKVHM